MAGYQQLTREGVGLLLGQRPVAMSGAEEVMAQLMRHRESLTNGWIVGVYLDDLAHETATQLAELVALADLEPALACDRMHHDRRETDAVLAQDLTSLLACVSRVRPLFLLPTQDRVRPGGRIVVDADNLGRFTAMFAIRAYGQL